MELSHVVSVRMNHTQDTMPTRCVKRGENDNEILSETVGFNLKTEDSLCSHDILQLSLTQTMNILLPENNFPLIIYILPVQFPSGIIYGDTKQEQESRMHTASFWGSPSGR